jgi:hypothetical protein
MVESVNILTGRWRKKLVQGVLIKWRKQNGMSDSGMDYTKIEKFEKI